MSSAVLDRLFSAYESEAEKRRKELEARQTGNTRSKFVRLIEKRIAPPRNQDARVIVAGEGGIGKSSFTLRMAEVLNPELYVDKYQEAIDQAVSFTAKEFMNSIRVLPNEETLDFDEPGQAWYHRQFMSEANMILSKTMLGFRYRKFKSFLNIPNIDLLDLDAQRLTNWLVWIPRQGHAEVYRVLVQKFGGDPWYKTVIDDMTFGKPGTKLWHAYEKKKFAAQDELYERFGKKLDELERPKYTQGEMLDLARREPEKYMKDGHYHYAYLMSDFQIGLNRAYILKAELERNQSKEGGQVSQKTATTEEASDLLKKVLD